MIEFAIVNVLLDWAMYLWGLAGNFNPCSIWILARLYEGIYCHVDSLINTIL